MERARLSGRSLPAGISQMALDVRSHDRHRGTKASVPRGRPLQRGGNRPFGRHGRVLCKEDKAMRYALIIAGGSGTRLWPMSRDALPKQLIPFLEGKSLLEIAY